MQGAGGQPASKGGACSCSRRLESSRERFNVPNQVSMHTSTRAGTPAGTIGDWLFQFERALAARDIAATLSLFQERCFWRDLVAFTWNIKTMEGPAAIADFLTATLAEVEPKNFAIEGEARESEDTVEARFTFETRVFCGRGHLRLKDGKGYTLLTTANALKGHEEKAGRSRVNGVAHGVHPNRQSWLELKL